MKVIETYKSYKEKYREYVVLIKSGIFYEVYGDDVGIMYSFFNYKIRVVGNNFNVGFPISKITNVIDVLEDNKINYVVVENNEIVLKNKFNNNKYNKYKIDLSRLTYLNNRISKINDKLSSRIMDNDIESILFNIEKLL